MFLTVLKGVGMVGVNISVTLLCQPCSFCLDDKVQAISCYVIWVCASVVVFITESFFMLRVPH